MDKELIYRALTLVLLVLMLGISIFFRRRADREGGQLSGDTGQRLVLLLRLLSLIIVLPLLGYLVNPAWVSWARVDLPDWLRWLGAGGALAAALLGVWVFRSIGINISPSHATRAGHRLVTHGPYHWVRHPLYSTGLLFYFSLTLLTGLWWLGAGGLIPLSVLMWRTPREEARLVEVFGDEYRAYMRRTGRFLPRLSAKG
jgi:protein-S-isoprenylcysteine O-methyltransferase Ste14